MSYECMACGIEGLSAYTGEPPMCLKCGGELEEVEDDDESVRGWQRAERE